MSNVPSVPSLPLGGKYADAWNSDMLVLNVLVAILCTQRCWYMCTVTHAHMFIPWIVRLLDAHTCAFYASLIDSWPPDQYGDQTGLDALNSYCAWSQVWVTSREGMDTSLTTRLVILYAPIAATTPPGAHISPSKCVNVLPISLCCRSRWSRSSSRGCSPTTARCSRSRSARPGSTSSTQGRWRHKILTLGELQSLYWSTQLVSKCATTKARACL